MRKILIIAPLLILMAAIAYFMIYKQMPHYALQQVEKATVKRNQALFEKYVDVDALSESLARQFVSYATRYKDAEIAGQDPQAIAREYTPELNNVFKTIVIDYIQHGKYPSAGTTVATTNRSPEAMLMQLQDYIVNRLEFAGFSTVRIGDGYADLTADFFSPSQTSSHRLELKMADKGKYWQIVEISNLDQFLKSIESL
jgi:hypothetical protein